MRNLEADSLWGEVCLGYHIQARPDQTTIEALQLVQRQIAETTPVALHLVPPDSLHVSVVTLIAPQIELGAAESEWLRISKNLGRQLDELLCLAKPEPVLFPRLAFTPRALIVVTDSQPDVFSGLRLEYGKLFESIGLSARKYDQTHITIARFAEARSVDNSVLELIEREKIDLLGCFDAVRLVRERRYPSLEIDEL